ncbi:hypothetical protein NFJ02_37g94970 [Pycnococcus provasolii]
MDLYATSKYNAYKGSTWVPGSHWPSETIGAILKQRGIGFILAFSRKSQPRKKIDAAIANIIKNNDRVFIDGLITTTKSVHVYDPENSFGKAAKNHMKFVPRVNDHGRHSAACILGCVQDAAFIQSPTAYNGSADGQPIQLEQNGSFFRSVCRLYEANFFLTCGSNCQPGN